VPFHCGIPASGAKPAVGKGGCLFNILSDPTEHDDVAAAHPAIVAEMYARIEELQASAFGPARGVNDGAACRAATHKWGGFWGPFAD